MNKTVFFFLLLCGQIDFYFKNQIIFCQEDYSADTTLIDQAKDQKTKSLKDQAQDFVDRTWNWMQSRLVRRKKVTPRVDDSLEPLSMHDTFDESEKELEGQRVFEQIEKERAENEAKRKKQLLDVAQFLNDPNFLQTLTEEEIDQLNFADIAPKRFATLSVAAIKALLNQPKLLVKLSKQQVQSINPERLSNVLKDRLVKSLDDQFVQKLSWRQIRQILADHTGWRLKNWLTDFKANFSSQALELMKNKISQTEEEFKDHGQEQSFLEIELHKLPQSKRPQDVNKALEYMQEGEQLWLRLKQGVWKKSGEPSPILEQVFRGMTNYATITDEQKKDLIDIFNGIESQGRNEELFQEFIKSYQKVIIKLQWYFYKLSILEDGRAFEGGAITFKDTEGNLFNFLDNYARLISPDYTSFWNSWNSKAYKRTSSHFKGEVQDKNIGIDIATDELGLPLNAPHLLFDQRKNGYIFLKWEPHGMSTLKDVGVHGWSFLTTRGENDESKHTKDRIPADVKNKFWALYQGPKTAEIKKQVDAQGIAGMLALLSESSKKEFMQYLTQDRAKNVKLRNYHQSTLSVRRGGEAIITPA